MYATLEVSVYVALAWQFITLKYVDMWLMFDNVSFHATLEVALAWQFITHKYLDMWWMFDNVFFHGTKYMKLYV